MNKKKVLVDLGQLQQKKITIHKKKLRTHS